ncbi:MAG: hypothetical protein RIE73_26255 [Coleofasciculus sp. C1-SOL-03]|uniref:hypothetical protein n=1 Tax=Coleofasciculus sp. C1-SOL-03 TaxID=3069522 RepID=UPI0032FD550F
MNISLEPSWLMSKAVCSVWARGRDFQRLSDYTEWKSVNLRCAILHFFGITNPRRQSSLTLAPQPLQLIILKGAIAVLNS